MERDASGEGQKRIIAFDVFERPRLLPSLAARIWMDQAAASNSSRTKTSISPLSITHLAEPSFAPQPRRKVCSRDCYRIVFCSALIVVTIACAVFSINYFTHMPVTRYPEMERAMGKLRASQFGQLGDSVYLDATGAGLYQQKQISAFAQRLNSTLFCNTHSSSSCSLNSEESVEQARQRLLKFFGVDQSKYRVVFTKSTTHSLQLLGETFPGGTLFVGETAHTSVWGLQTYFDQTVMVPAELYQCSGSNAEQAQESTQTGKAAPAKKSSEKTYDLIALPGKDNFVGVKTAADAFRSQGIQDFVRTHQSVERKVYTLLDIAALAPGWPVDLGELEPDFAVLSAYKMFGFPTSVGVLFIRAGVEDILVKRYFGGGTVITQTTDGFVGPRKSFHRFEDGSLDFLGISAVPDGISALEELSMPRVARWIAEITRFARSGLEALRHPNGRQMVRIYTPPGAEDGGILAFNLLDADGNAIGYAEPLSFFSSIGLNLRGGCHCNPGACQRYLQTPASVFKRAYQTKTSCGDATDEFEGYLLGALRASFGYWSLPQDARSLSDAVSLFFQ